MKRMSGSRPIGWRRPHGFAKRAFDVRSALRLERIEIARRVAKVRRSSRETKSSREGADVAREVDETKAVVGAQRSE